MFVLLFLIPVMLLAMQVGSDDWQSADDPLPPTHDELDEQARVDQLWAEYRARKYAERQHQPETAEEPPVAAPVVPISTGGGDEDLP